jgi:hypothetical protein
MKTNWSEQADKVRQAMASAQPNISIDTVMLALGYTSKASAEYALKKLEAMGVVKQTGGKWYLTS